MTTVASELFALDDAKIHIERQGSGKPVLFVHGVMMSSRFFAPQMAYFSRFADVIVPDLRGHGRSPFASSGHTVPQYARDIARIIEAYDLRDVTLVGWSMGAFVVWDYLSQFGSARIARIAIVDEYPADFKWPGYEFGFADLPMLAGMMELIQTDYGAVIEQLIGLMFKHRPSEYQVAWIAREIAAVDPAIASAIFFDQTMRDYRELLPRIDVPALICMGGDEKLVPVAAGQYIADRIPQATLTVFEESCHCPFLEEPDEFNRRLHDFMQT
ncbi:alpha/beta hydrolase [Novosphingobium aromaticivorans DSM 12444]|uniref:Alpha/beta hydrolase n=1 Tax=Novosphingobium aromaticivorans (strain ATCC 700278 / DSM 12444 / CCUG 56034 / CIP 105152 / NBRC 16084 / F199) TaxID=279238 RepID=Q2G524_NOVAD|nr:alpha/beta hydrolase [Novosphingobium aromaticivorans]ABD27049.1 alpha/beta hydrolase [Novosphingobium aromaticivorans DSM 12444]SCY48985.1 Pimeloyl-ACP methyl ester carboxylesterase [Novosphingobium aromaticivorans]